MAEAREAADLGLVVKKAAGAMEAGVSVVALEAATAAADCECEKRLNCVSL